MTFFCSLYSLWVAADRPVPGLTSFLSVPAVDIQIWLNSRSPFPPPLPAVWGLRYTSPCQDAQGVPVLTVREAASGEYFLINYSDGTGFCVDRLGTQIWANWPDNLTLPDVTTYLLGPVFGFVLRLRGLTSLHASAVVVGDQAIALLGPAGVGKSTMAAAFASLGHPVLSDDVVPILEEKDCLLVPPAYPRICLWPESVKFLYGSREALPRLAPSWDKRYLNLNGSGNRFQRTPVPLAAVYLLDERTSDPAAPAVEAVSARAGFITLVANTYLNYLLDKPMRAREFEVLAGVVSRVPLRRVRPHADPARLWQTCDLILDDLSTLSAPDPAYETAARG